MAINPFRFHGAEDRAASGHARTWYEATATELPRHAVLEGEAQCDVAVVGGGLTGLSCALSLAERGYGVTLLEARRIGWGASGRNGGQLLTGQRVDQITLERRLGNGPARQLWDLAEAAKCAVRSRMARHRIECDLAPGALTAAVKTTDYADLQKAADHLGTHYAYDALRLVDPEAMHGFVASRCYRGGLWDGEAGHLHPLNYALGLARAAAQAGVRLCENSPVLSVTGSGPPVLVTDHARLRAGAVVMATNGYHTGLSPRIDDVVLPINSFVGVTRPLGPELARSLLPRGGCVADTRFVLDYYRLTPDHRLLFGGGESYGPELPRRIEPIIRQRIARVFPQLKGVPVDYAWGGRLGVTRTRMPFIGTLGPDRYVAAGFSGQGLAITTQAGSVIAEAIAGTAERFDVYARLEPRILPGGRWFRRPLITLAMTWGALQDLL
ncbi:MAG: NAD(P)/FAD-dependent oxidoreductase [Alphaproteobacteria bacterium]